MNKKLNKKLIVFLIGVLLLTNLGILKQQHDLELVKQKLFQSGQEGLIGGITRTKIGTQTAWTTDLIPSGSFSVNLGSSAKRVVKGWFTNLDISGSCTGCGSGSAFTGLLMGEGLTTPTHITQLTYSPSGFDFSPTASAGILSIDYTNGPASRSMANTWTQTNTFNGLVNGNNLLQFSGTGSNSFGGSLAVTKGFNVAKIVGTGLTINTGNVDFLGVGSHSFSGSLDVLKGLRANNITITNAKGLKFADGTVQTTAATGGSSVPAWTAVQTLTWTSSAASQSFNTFTACDELMLKGSGTGIRNLSVQINNIKTNTYRYMGKDGTPVLTDSGVTNQWDIFSSYSASGSANFEMHLTGRAGTNGYGAWVESANSQTWAAQQMISGNNTTAGSDITTIEIRPGNIAKQTAKVGLYCLNY